MPVYQKLGEIPRKRHIKFPREKDSYKGEQIHYEHVVTTQGFDRVRPVIPAEVQPGRHRRPTTPT